jgi:hypothetical protein
MPEMSAVKETEQEVAWARPWASGWGKLMRPAGEVRIIH